MSPFLSFQRALKGLGAFAWRRKAYASLFCSAFLSLVLLSAVLPSSAHAGDPSSGFYVGAAFGLSRATSDADVKSSLRDYTGEFEDGQDVSGGLFFGYGVAFDRMVLAVEGGWNFNAVNDSTDIVGSSNNRNIGTLNIDYGPSFGGDIRLGYMVTDRLLAYGRAGIHVASMDLNFTLTSVTPTRTSTESISDAIAYRFGTGGDYFFNPKLFLRTEYVYTKFASVSGDFTSLNTLKYEIEPDMHQVSVGIGIKF